jgi:AraC-like DNA-binding protein
MNPIAGISIAIFLLSLLVSKRQKLLADRFLIIYLSFFIVSLGYFYYETTGALEYSSWMILGKGIYLLGGPLFFHYVYTLTKGKRPSTRIIILTLLPFILYVIVFFYYRSQVFEKIPVQIENGILYVNGELSMVWTIFIIAFFLTDPFYVIWFYFLLRSYKRNLKQSLSNTDRVNLNWLSTLFYLWLVIAFVLLPVSLLGIGNNVVSESTVDLSIRIANVLFIFVAGFYGFRQTTIFLNTEVTQPAYERSGLSKEQAKKYHAELLALMKEKRPYLNGELSAAQLASQLGISVNHLSQVLNQEQGQNFFDFVNSYRVREVQEKMADPSNNHLTLLAIALESGFNSKTSFNTLFKKIAGKTPTQYHKSLKTGSNR